MAVLRAERVLNILPGRHFFRCGTRNRTKQIETMEVGKAWHSFTVFSCPVLLYHYQLQRVGRCFTCVAEFDLGFL